jgi:hypothetical protein
VETEHDEEQKDRCFHHLLLWSCVCLICEAFGRRINC